MLRAEEVGDGFYTSRPPNQPPDLDQITKLPLPLITVKSNYVGQKLFNATWRPQLGVVKRAWPRLF